MAVILVVDDEDTVLNNLSRFLARLGHEVRTAPNGRDALAMLAEAEVDLLITDINMPVMDGIEVINTLRARGSTFPIIAMSGGGVFDKDLLLGTAGALGAATTLDKPFDLQTLGREVARALG